MSWQEIINSKNPQSRSKKQCKSQFKRRPLTINCKSVLYGIDKPVNIKKSHFEQKSLLK